MNGLLQPGAGLFSSAAMLVVLMTVAGAQAAIPSPTGAEAVTAAMPDTMKECESGICGLWYFKDKDGKGWWVNGAIANLTREILPDRTIVITRQDTDGPSRGLTAVYKTIPADDKVTAGQVEWKSGAMQRAGTWTAELDRLTIAAAKERADDAKAKGNNFGFLRWAIAGSALGDAVMQNDAGLSFARHTVFSVDYEMAARLFRASADQGNVQGELNLGYAYATGTGVPLDREHANALFTKAGPEGAKAGQQFQMVIQNGDGPSLQCQQERASGLSGKAAAEQGALAFTQKDRESATCYMQIAAADGVPLGQYYIGYYEPNPDLARQLLQKAVNGGSAQAMDRLASLEEQGLGGPLDAVQAANLRARAMSLMAKYEPLCSDLGVQRLMIESFDKSSLDLFDRDPRGINTLVGKRMHEVIERIANIKLLRVQGHGDFECAEKIIGYDEVITRTDLNGNSVVERVHEINGAQDFFVHTIGDNKIRVGLYHGGSDTTIGVQMNKVFWVVGSSPTMP